MDKPRGILLLIALAFLAAGLFPMLDALSVFSGSEDRMNAPRSVVFLAGSLFFMAGMWLLLQAIVGQQKALAFGSVVGVAIFLGLSAIVHWVAFGAGVRECSGGISGFGIGFESSTPELECRVGFGYCALLLDFLLLRGIAWQLGRQFPGNRAIWMLEKAAEWGMGLMLLPLILLAVGLSKVKAGWDRVVAAVRSGKPGSKPPPPA